MNSTFYSLDSTFSPFFGKDSPSAHRELFLLPFLPVPITNTYQPAHPPPAGYPMLYSIPPCPEEDSPIPATGRVQTSLRSWDQWDTFLHPCLYTIFSCLITLAILPPTHLYATAQLPTLLPIWTFSSPYLGTLYIPSHRWTLNFLVPHLH